jgi:DNA (cytosine-5)-methyltransferase 1
MGADDFKLNVPLNQALFGFGDAVCVPVIEWIARNYLNPVWDEHYASAPSPMKSVGSVSYRDRETTSRVSAKK